MERYLVWFALIPAAGFLFGLLTLVRARTLAAEDGRWAASTGQPYFSHSGDAWVGRSHYRAAYSTLTLTPTMLRLVCGWKRYEFPRISIERLGTWNALWGGLAIHHNNPDYPSLIAFVPRDMRALRSELERLGYQFEDGYKSK